MAAITHAFTSAKSDGGDASLVRPTDWNAAHVVTKGVFPGLPSGTLSRSYTFASTVESWTTTAGTLSSTGGKLQLTHTSPAVAIEPVGASNIADGELELDYFPITTTGSASILFRVTDSSNFYAWIFQPSVYPTLYKFVAGTPTALYAAIATPFGGAGVSAMDGFQVRVLCRFVGTAVSLYLNGTMVAGALDSTYSTGRVGLRADNATMQIDNVKLYSGVDLVTGNVLVP